MLVELHAGPLNLNFHSLACASKATCRPQMYTCSLQGFEQPAMFVNLTNCLEGSWCVNIAVDCEHLLDCNTSHRKVAYLTNTDPVQLQPIKWQSIFDATTRLAIDTVSSRFFARVQVLPKCAHCMH